MAKKSASAPHDNFTSTNNRFTKEVVAALDAAAERLREALRAAGHGEFVPEA